MVNIDFLSVYLEKGKRPVVRTADLFVLIFSVHGLTTHDYACLELRHHHAEKRIVILLLII